MILILDVGNSQIFGGVFDDGKLTLRFRRAARALSSCRRARVFLPGR